MVDVDEIAAREAVGRSVEHVEDSVAHVVIVEVRDRRRVVVECVDPVVDAAGTRGRHGRRLLVAPDRKLRLDAGRVMLTVQVRTTQWRAIRIRRRDVVLLRAHSYHKQNRRQQYGRRHHTAFHSSHSPYSRRTRLWRFHRAHVTVRERSTFRFARTVAAGPALLALIITEANKRSRDVDWVDATVIE